MTKRIKLGYIGSCSRCGNKGRPIIHNIVYDFVQSVQCNNCDRIGYLKDGITVEKLLFSTNYDVFIRNYKE